MTAILFDTEDVARGQLNAGLAAAGLTITLKTGEGAEFPQPLSGTASSTGSSTTLNDTSDLGSLAVGDFIRNVTDGSWAFVTSISGAPDSVTTTRLVDGTDNTWQNGDVWRHGEFIVTLIKTDDGLATGQVTKRERVLVSGRTTDQLTVPSGGRGYDGTVAQTFDADDYVNIYISAITFDSLRDLLFGMRRQQNTNQTDIANLQIDAPSYVGTVAGTDTLTGTVSPAITAYTAGQKFIFIAANDNTGSVTLNLNSLGAKTIKKIDGATNLSAGDIQSGQAVLIMYDGTNFQMLSPIGQSSNTATRTLLYKSTADSNDVTSGTGDTEMNTKYEIAAGTSVAGDVITIEAWGLYDGGVNNRQLRLKLKWEGTTLISFDAFQPTTAGTLRAWYVKADITIRSIGATGTVQASGEARCNNSSTITELFSRMVSNSTVTVDTTVASDIVLTQSYNVDDGTKHCYTKQVMIYRDRI